MNAFRYEYLLVATDTALSIDERRQSCAKLTIIITDVNDNKPIITSISSTIYLPKSTPVNTYVFAYTAIDLDSSSNITFLQGDVSNSAWIYFKLDPKSGVVNTKVLFDINAQTDYNLAVIARDSPDSSYLQSDPVTITIKVMNDNSILLFTKQLYDFSIDENMPSGSVIGSVFAFDSNNIEYSISGEYDTINIFEINKVSGYISVKVSLDFETQTSYRFNVTAHDTTNQKKDALCVVIVKINDQNDVWPIIDNVTISRISENAGPGQILATVHVTDADTSTMSENGLTYVITPSSFPVIVLKQHQQTEAIIITTKDFDAEDMSINNNKFNISVIDAAGHVFVKLITFPIVDQNDNNPVFSIPIYTFTVPENSPDKTIIGIVTATDKDLSEIYRTIRYSLIDALNNPNIMIDSVTGVIVTNGIIDYEKKARYYLTAVASDSIAVEATQRKACAVVIVNVDDLNDNPPVFTSATYFSVSEKTSVGTVVFKLSATDADTSSQITFSSLMISPFKITSQGDVVLVTELNYEEKKQYSLEVLATDNVFTTNQSVTAYILNENDNDPVFLQNLYRISILENRASMGNPFLTVMAIDNDLPPFNNVTYELIDAYGIGAGFQFYLLDSSGRISYYGTFDREVKEVYQFLVKAINSGDNSRSAITYVEVTIEDENDNAPMVQQLIYNLTISENTLIGQTILHIDATDPDKGTNSDIIFSFVPGVDQSGNFIIDPKEGDISVENTLNYAVLNNFQLAIKVSDSSALKPLSTFVNVFIYLTEELNNYPSTFLKTLVSENKMVNTIVNIESMTVWNLNSVQLSYEIVFYDNQDSSVFRINSQNGNVVLIQPLDYESKREYIFMRRAMLNDIIYGVQTVNIIVIDENDNDPVFDFPNEIIFVSVNENSQIGTCLALVNASDADERSRGKLIFSINPPVSGFNVLSVKDMGKIFVEKNLDAEKNTFYELHLLVNDSEGRSSLLYKIVNILVVDLNDNSPIFDQSEYIFNKLEGPYENSFIGKVSATDKDVTPLNNNITYSIANNDANKVFQIDSTGNIYLKRELDREATPKFNFIVEAANVIEGQKTVGYCNVTVIVGDINDNSPTYYGNRVFSFDEDTPLGSTLFYIRGEDLDFGVNAELEYLFEYIGAVRAPTTVLGLIDVDNVTGQVTLIDLFDYEKATQYTMSVNIADKGSPQNVLNILFTINILDVNDNSPQFNVRPQTLLKFSFQENVPYNYTFGNVMAIDIDSGLNSQIRYSIVNILSTSNFAIDQISGRLYTNSLFDYEVLSQYYFLVVASDNGYPQLSDTIPVALTIIDVNDNIPVFSQVEYNITILQGTPAGLSIGKVKALDSDSGLFGLVKYFLKSGNTEIFKIDQLTGDILTLQQVSLTANSSNRYEIVIEAQDSDPVYPRSSQDVRMIINVLRIVTEVSQPQFVLPYLEVYLREDQALGVVANTVVLGALVNYSIITDSSQARQGIFKFSIDSLGNLLLNSYLDYEEEQTISYTIKAKLDGSNIYGTQNVLVIVQDVDDNKPVLAEPRQQNVTIASLAKIGIIASVKATDIDSVSKGKLTYSLVNNYSNQFSIISINDVGLVVLNQVLVGEHIYLLEVRVQDPAGNIADEVNTIKVIVTPEQGPGLHFTKTLYSFIIPEDSGIGYDVGYVLGVVSDTVKLLLSNGTSVNALVDIEYSMHDEFDDAKNIFSVQKNGSILSNIYFNSTLKPQYLFSVEATINVLGLTAISWVHVGISYQNTKPVFLSPNNYTITEDFPTDTVIFKVIALDDSSLVTYSVEQCTGDLIINMNPLTGEAVYKVGLDYEKVKTHTCLIRAQDQTTLFENQVITIYVVNVNEYNPVFETKLSGKNSYTSRVQESSAAIQALVTVRATDNDLDIFGVVHYSIVNALTPMPFSVDPLSGLVSTTESLDYESVKNYEVLIMASDGGSPPRTDVISVLVNVIDINDNFPIFDTLNYTTTIYSNIPVPTIILLVHATDADLGNEKISYAFATGSSQLFSINEKTGVISLVNVLDYNNLFQPPFHIVVTATDYQTGYPSKTSAAYVTINVTEGMNGSITFIEPYKVIDLFENQTVHEVVFTTQLTPLNFNILFSIIQTEEKNSFPFLIDSKGSLFLNQSLDYEVQKKFAFFIKAVELSDQSVSFQSIIVNVLDIDDEIPVIEMPFFRELYLYSDYYMGQAVSFIRVFDADSSDFDYEVLPDSVPFKVSGNGNVGILYVSEMLIQSNYTFKIKVYDMDSTGIIKNAAVNDVFYSVIVNSLPISLLKFTRPIYAFMVNENNDVLKTIGAVDVESSYVVKFSIVEKSIADTFLIDVNTGTITVQISLDYESAKQYLFTVLANDEFGNSATAIVSVIVIDVNDNKPLFKGLSLYNILENAELGSVLFSLCATDADTGINSLIRFTLENIVPQIQVNQDSGDVVLVGNFDYEKINKVELNISASDQGNPQQTTYRIYTLVVANINDHNPVFSSPEDLLISLHEDSKPNNDVANVTATDADVGIYGEVTYSLYSTMPILPFTILQSGIIRQTASLDYEKIKSYNFYIKASDGGSPPRIAIKAVSINVLDVNDNSPFFTQPFYSATISELSPIGTAFIQVSALDFDTGFLGSISYAIVSGGDDSFGINNQSGSIFVASKLNANLKDHYVLFVNASDKGPFSNTASTIVYVNVTSNTQPHFATSVQFINLYENEVPHIIGSAIALNTNRTFTYSILYTDAGNIFSIDPISGDLYLNGTLDYEKEKLYSFTVSATSNFFSGYQLVNIIVLDINDNSPSLTPSTQTITISESTLISQPFAFLRAFDADSVSKNNLSMSFSSQFNAFGLDFDGSSLAYIYVKKDLHVLAQSQCVIKLSISDGVFVTNASVYINITQNELIVNELQFQYFVYTLQLSELEELHHIFASVLATFHQNNQLNISYTILEAGLPFDIDVNSGELSLNSALDYEQTDLYYFHVMADAKDSNRSYAAYTSVVVNVLDANDNAPIFEQTTYVQVLSENYLVGTTVLQVRATDKDSGEAGRVTYSLNVSGITEENYPFYIDQNTGVIVLYKVLDFETKISYSVTLFASDHGEVQHVTTAKLQIIVTDSNDNAPVFQKPFQTLVVSEEIENVELGCISASDYDASSLNNKITYKLLSAGSDYNNAFSVNISGCINLSKKLDREVQDKYHFILIATDNGVPSLSGYTEMEIFVLDINDHIPKFAHSIYNLQISELVPNGTLLISVQATDEDFGVNSNISYTIVSGNIDSAFLLLSNGDIITQKSIKNSNVSFYQLKIKAEDHGIPSLSSVLIINIEVIGYDVIMPLFDKTYYEVSVNENFIGKIFQVNASFIDFTVNLKVRYAVIETSVLGRGKLSIDNNGSITIEEPFDYEFAPAYIFIVKAFTDNDPEVFSTAVFRLILKNLNDNIPVFKRTLFEVSVARQSKTGTTIATVHADDPDEDANSLITYSFQPNQVNNSLFGVNLNLGEVTLLREIQFDDIKNYVLKIFAFDSSGVASAEPAILNVKIYPDNMFKPTFDSSPLFFIISESADKSTVVGNVIATDGDADLPPFAILERPEAANFGSLFYSILSSSGSIPFSISTSGVISVSSSLDREKKSVYDLYIQATDGGNPGFSSVKLVTVLVSDTNENPVFVKQVYSIEVMESVPIGFSILAVSANDLDIGINGIVDYSIVSGNDGTKFKINSATGVISLIDYLDVDAKQNYVLEVQAVDQGVPPLASSVNATVKITVLRDLGQEIPLFFVSYYEFSVEENTEKELGFISATASKPISYRILNDSDYVLFSIDQQGLLIILNSDYETQRELNIFVEAYFTLNPNISSIINVHIFIEDLNDNAPSFVQPQFNVTVSEFANVGDIIAVFNAFDADSTTNADVSFGLSYININISPFDVFVISTLNNNTGVIKLKAKLDFESRNEYLLAVSLADMGFPQLFAPNINFTVFVKDENDNAPFPVSEVTSINVYQNTSLGSILYVLKFKDNDSGLNQELLFELVNVFGGNRNPFILSNNGFIELYSNLEAVDKYTLFITVQDKGKPFRQTSFTFTINIIPAVVFSPYFDPILYNTNVKENVLVGTAIEKLIVVDKNVFDSSVSFRIVSGNVGSVFEVNSLGEIVVSQALDAEKKNQYLLYVSVANKYVQAELNAIINISVIDVNDNAPIFSKNVFFKEVQEDMLVNEVIDTYIAYDLDSGLNGLVRYKLVDATNTFKMYSNGTLLLNKTLDWHVQSNYSLMVVAFDAGFPPKYATAYVFIHVIDVNSPPLFDVTYYTKSILETIKVGSTLLQVEVTDNDEDKNGQIFITVPKDVESMFGFEGRFLVLKNVLSSALTPRYEFAITARDNGSPPLQANPLANVNLTIYGISSLQPHFLLSEYKVLDLMENVFYNMTAILNATAFINGSTAIYVLDDSEDSQYFTITNEGSIFSKVVFDYETKPFYVFGVIAKNSANLSYWDQTVVKLYIKDTNDNAPVLLPSTYVFNISDKVSVGTVVGIITATDKDSGTNAQLMYSLQNLTNNNFILIDNLLVVNAVLDYRVQSDYEFFIYAADNGVPQLKSVQGHIMVHLIPTNLGVSPTFTQKLYVVSILDNITSADIVLNVKAVQINQSNNDTITYLLDSSIDSFHFTINSITGDIKLKPGFRFSYLTRKKYVFYAIATEMFGYSDMAFVVINVVDSSGIDHTRPIFLQEEYITAISESLPIGSTVVTVQAIDSDSLMLTYSILSGNELNLFYITTSGAIVVKDYLGIDTNGIDSYLLEISAQDEFNKISVRNAIVKIYLISTSQTVNHLLFEYSSYSFSIPENTQPQKIGTLLAKISSGKQEDVKYKVLSLGLLFEMNGTDLCSKQPFDREQKDKYVFQILAYSNNSNSDKTLIIIDISDENDHSPVFNDNQLSIILTEFTEVDSVVATVAATDEDIGDNKEVDYDLSSQDLFSIDKYGQIVLIQPLTQYTPQFIFLTAMASNPGSDKQSFMQINITVIKEESPQFSNTSYSIFLYETNDLLLNILTLTAKSSKSVNYTMTDSKYSPFSIDSGTGVLSTIGPIDYEKNKYFDMCVEAYQIDHPVIESTVHIHVDVLDVNDNVPTTEKFNYSISVSETALLHSQIITIFANDLDSDKNGELVYEIMDGDINGTFSINDEGVVVLEKLLDFTSIPSYLLKVMIYDKGVPRLNITQPVNIQIEVQKFDYGSLLFVSGPLVVTVNESATKQYITNVSVVDLNNISIAYKLVDYSDVFTIDDQGKIWSVAGLNYTKQSKYIILVMASANKRTGYRQITINVNDINENPFIIKILTFPVYASASINTLVAQVIAQDPDSLSDQNGKVNYSIISGNNAHVFSFNIYGEILTQKLLDLEQVFSYQLSIVVSDNGTPSLSSEIWNLTIEILNVDDNSTIFENSSYSFTFIENSNTSIDILATNSTNKGPITYSIKPTDAQSWFSFGPDNKIYPRQVLDYETWHKFSFVVVAVDLSNHETIAEVDVKLIDINDNPPVFFPTNYMVRIPINTTSGTTIISINATDADSNENAKLRFHLTDDTKTFSIDENSGAIKTMKSLVNTIDVYTLHVNVSDNGTIPLSAQETALVVVYIQFFTVKFDQQVYRYTLKENTDNMILEAVHASSAIGVSYSLGDSNDHFTIDQNGTITVIKGFDYEKDKEFVFMINATTDYSIDTAIVVVTVLDVNDNPPVFVTKSINVYLQSPLQAGFLITTVKAEDLDANSDIKYFIKNQNESIFVIDSQKGEVTLTQNIISSFTHKLEISANDSVFVANAVVIVTVFDISNNSNCFLFENSSHTLTVAEGQNFSLNVNNGMFINASYSLIPSQTVFSINSNGLITNILNIDYETQKSYAFIVKVNTLGSESYFSVEINVTDVNDIAPIFVSCNYNKTYLNMVSVGTSVLQVHATDADSRIVVYSLDETGLPFSINESTGVVTAKDLLNTSYIFSIIAKDNGVPQKKVESIVHIALNLVPICQPPQLVNINETNSTGIFVANISATSQDPKGLLYYYILGTEVAVFNINAATGVITNNVSLDYESIRKYTLLVEVRNSLELDYRTCATTIEINIVNLPDTPPVFDSNPIEISLSYLWPVNVEILKITATNPENISSIHYSLIDDTTFSIDKETGSLSLKKVLSMAVTFTVTVIAEIQASLSLKANKSVKIDFKDFGSVPINVVAQDSPSADSINAFFDLNKFFNDNTWKKYKTIKVYVQRFKPGICELLFF